MVNIRTFEMSATVSKDTDGTVKLTEVKELKELSREEFDDTSILRCSKEVSDFNQKELKLISTALNPGETREISYQEQRVME